MKMRVQLDAGDVLDAEQMRRQHVAAAADADHRGLAMPGR